VGLLNKRALETLEVRKIKRKLKKGIFTPHREKEVYEKIVEGNKGPLSEKSIKAIYREVMSASLALQRPLTIAYLGPGASFTQIAAIEKFGNSLEYKSLGSIADVFTEVEKGRADYGVVPIENSTEGAVNHTLDMFVDSDLKICSEVYLDIQHNLLSKQRNIKSIKTVYSHQQVFAQCRKWLEANLARAKLIPAASTTDAAFLASRHKNSAAIASRKAAEEFRLEILARSIEDSAHNITRFLVIGQEEAKPTRNDKTSIVFSLKDRVGVLHDALIPFKKNGINLTKIESRPSRMKAWEYYFFVDLTGHYKDKKAKKALKELEKSCTYLKMLGSYPIGI